MLVKIVQFIAKTDSEKTEQIILPLTGASFSTITLQNLAVTQIATTTASSKVALAPRDA